MAIDWARSVRNQCVEARVPLHFKLWGNYAQVDDTGEQLIKLRTPHERQLDGRTWDESPTPKKREVAAAE